VRLFSLALMLMSGLSVTSAPALAHSSTGSMTMSMGDVAFQEIDSLVKSDNNQGEISSYNDMYSDMSCEDSCAATPCPASNCAGKIINALPYHFSGSFSFAPQLAFADQIEYSSKFASIFHPPKQ